MSSTLLHVQQRALLAELAVVEAQEAQVFARKMELRARMDALWNTADGEGQEQFGVLELAGAARIGQSRASSQLVNGTRLRDALPGTLDSLREGRMFRETAVLLLELTRNCSLDVMRELERRALPLIVDANTADVRRLVVKLIPEVEADLDPALTEERLEEARARRDVWLSDRGEGMVGVTGAIDAVSARRWSLDFEECVRAQKVADDKAGIVRTAAQRRADVFAQLPSRFLALLQAVRKGQTEQLLALSLADPDLADDLEALAATLPMDMSPDSRSALADESDADVSDADVSDADADCPTAALCDAAAEDVPAALEPPLDPSDEPDRAPAHEVPHWTDLSQLELASTVMGLPVRNPRVLAVHVGMSTLLALDNRTGRIDQGGALPASQVRLLLPDAELQRVLVDAGSGVPLGIDPILIPASASASMRDRLVHLLTAFELSDQAEPRHDPSRRLRALVELRDQHCTGVGCSQPAGRCHLDHETPYPEGPTAAWNLGAKSARCHRAKHAGWTVTRHGPGPQADGSPPGSTTWTSPLGHSYTRLSAWMHPANQDRECDAVIEIDAPVHGTRAA